mmetsp:Transcript_20055/g.20367  ORF Transcript_20055/g.20367 Transcript_20055/m.20367 type:complete len:87 (-) Transcript_20055:398-658(-)
MRNIAAEKLAAIVFIPTGKSFVFSKEFNKVRIPVFAAVSPNLCVNGTRKIDGYIDCKLKFSNITHSQHTSLVLLASKSIHYNKHGK